MRRNGWRGLTTGALLALVVLAPTASWAAPELMQMEGFGNSPGQASAAGVREIGFRSHSPHAGGGVNPDKQTGCCPTRRESDGISLKSLIERVPDSGDLIAGGAVVARAVVRVVTTIVETWMNRSDGTPGLNEETARC